MIRVTWLGHATTVVDVGGVRFVTDPLLRRHAAPLRRRGPAPRPNQLNGVEAVLLSHLHHDHADVPSLRFLRHVPVFAASENARWLTRATGGEAVALEPHQWHRLDAVGGEIEVMRVRADHKSRPMPHRPNAAVGFLVRAGGRVIWFAGDTELYGPMVQLPALAGARIDLALLPIGGWGPRLSPGHMGPVEAARAAELAGVRHVVPIHWGSLHPPGMHLRSGWLTRPPAEFAEALSQFAPACTMIEAPVGQQITIPL